MQYEMQFILVIENNHVIAKVSTLFIAPGRSLSPASKEFLCNFN